MGVAAGCARAGSLAAAAVERDRPRAVRVGAVRVARLVAERLLLLAGVPQLVRRAGRALSPARTAACALPVVGAPAWSRSASR